MVAARGLVVSEVVPDELRSIRRKNIRHAAGGLIFPAFRIPKPLCAELPPQFVTAVGIHRIEIAVGADPAHVVHGDGCRPLDAGIVRGGVEGEAAPAADAENADLLRIDVRQERKAVHRGGKVLRVEVG